MAISSDPAPSMNEFVLCDSMGNEAENCDQNVESAAFCRTSQESMKRVEYEWFVDIWMINTVHLCLISKTQILLDVGLSVYWFEGKAPVDLGSPGGCMGTSICHEVS